MSLTPTLGIIRLQALARGVATRKQLLRDALSCTGVYAVKAVRPTTDLSAAQLDPVLICSTIDSQLKHLRAAPHDLTPLHQLLQFVAPLAGFTRCFLLPHHFRILFGLLNEESCETVACTISILKATIGDPSRIPFRVKPQLMKLLTQAQQAHSTHCCDVAAPAVQLLHLLGVLQFLSASPQCSRSPSARSHSDYSLTLSSDNDLTTFNSLASSDDESHDHVVVAMAQ
eukprot:NODE_4199_length_827_cov_23.790000_g4041_i0.p1 GENE.NODE_4199_length_827_cov_23.790000_g4041_i0~~NODE_4199_length_827_cov_23.790000_g4041_i0.p1  ORF type:complete len:252 (+),score=83.32 NODE_4199_length_827_cov_23.790000_g4041_i0:74-757(+)